MQRCPVSPVPMRVITNRRGQVRSEHGLRHSSTVSSTPPRVVISGVSSHMQGDSQGNGSAQATTCPKYRPPSTRSKRRSGAASSPSCNQASSPKRSGSLAPHLALPKTRSPANTFLSPREPMRRRSICVRSSQVSSRLDGSAHEGSAIRFSLRTRPPVHGAGDSANGTTATDLIGRTVRPDWIESIQSCPEGQCGNPLSVQHAQDDSNAAVDRLPPRGHVVGRRRRRPPRGDRSRRHPRTSHAAARVSPPAHAHRAAGLG